MTQPDEELLTIDEATVLDLEAPPEDAAEQAQPANPQDNPVLAARAVPWDATEYDAVEQGREVALDDEYR